MNLTLGKQALFRRLMRPMGEDGSDLGGSVDRGDSWTPTADAGHDNDDINPDNPDGETPPEKTDEPKTDEPKTEKTDDKAPRKDSRIPLSRHREILAKEREARAALERQVQQFQSAERVAKANDDLTKQEDALLKMERDYNKLLADGEVEKASAMMTQIRQAERAIVESKADMKAAAAAARAVEQARYDIALERIEEAYPVLNEGSDEYDEELVSDVADLKLVYQQRGMTPTQALQQAVKKLVGKSTKAQEKVLDTTPRVSEKDVAKERKSSAVSKAADAARRTPPSFKDVGMDNDKAGMTAADIMKMSQEEFAKLDPERLAALRGDTL